jgi:type 1 fimbria pilin
MEMKNLTCMMDKQNIKIVDMQHRHAPWTCSIIIQQGHPAQTCSVDMSAWRTSKIDKKNEKAAWTCRIDMQHGYAACTGSMNMEKGHTAWTWT